MINFIIWELLNTLWYYSFYEYHITFGIKVKMLLFFHKQLKCHVGSEMLHFSTFYASFKHSCHWCDNMGQDPYIWLNLNGYRF